MPTITDWLMVAITLVYVIATIFICRANIKSAKAALKSAKATQEQVAESKRQYKETRRLEIMPYLKFDDYDGPINKALELILVSGDRDGGTYIKRFSIKNIGQGTACDIAWIWNRGDGTYDKKSFPIIALQSGEMQTLEISFAIPKVKQDNIFGHICLKYKDLLGNSYMQEITFKFEYQQGDLALISCSVNSSSRIGQEDLYCA